MQEETTPALLLKINESFVEMAAFQGESPLFQRWFSPSIPLKSQLEGKGPFSEVQLVTKLGHTILQKKLGAAPAFLVTTGFENWLDMNIPACEDYFTINVSKPKSPISKDYVFAMNERTEADGKISKEVDTDELEFLASKLMLNNIKTVAIGFLHSATNPSNEKKVGDFLRDKGFSVFCSHECAHTNVDKGFVDSERQRWWVAVLNAYMQPTWHDEMLQLENTLNESFDREVNLKVVVNDGQLMKWQQALPLETLFAQEYLAYNYFKQNTPSKSKVLGLYLGVENFQVFEVFQEGHRMWKSEYGPVAIKQPYFNPLFVQPTTTVEEGFWSSPFLSTHTSGYEPGPMCFGKSVKPTFMDSLYIEEHLNNVPGLSEHLVEKTKKRISETFYTYSKDSLSSELILKLGVQAIAAELAQFPNNIVYCAGPLAPAMLPLLKSTATEKQFRNKDIDFCVLDSLLKGNSHE